MVEDGGTVTFTVEPVAEGAQIHVLPTLTANGKAVDWEGNKATVTITAKTAISITGGTVVNVAVKDEVNDKADVDETLKDELGDVSIKAEDTLISDIVPNITPGAITIEGVDITDEIVNEIIAALADETTKVSTSLKVDKAKDAAITEANTAVEASTEFGDDSNALGEDATAIKDKVKAMMAREDKVALDITLNSLITIGSGTNSTSASISVKSLGKEIEITMNKPESLNKKGVKGSYYAIRIHDGKATVIKCRYDETTKKITFKSNKFSTYIISFVEDDSTNKPTPPSGGGGIGGYVPSTSATPAPSATAAPSASPSADPSATPGVDSSAAPSESGAPAPGGDTTPTKAPTATDKPVDDNKDDNNTGGSTTVKVGKKATVSGSQYKVTAVKGTRTVQFTKGKKNAKSIVVPSTVKISGKNYKVTTIAKNAFKGNKKLAKVTIGKNVNKIGVSAFQNCSKLKSIVIKSTKLTAKKVGKNAFKGINKKATFKVPKSKVKAYKKIVKAKGAGKNVKVKK
ncbi:MAG: leucine-rich repeat domain-containing protein [Lachnospiraceae bacterium]|nr:leucine-rich repeat domain-containing protein [Lachnospiraceae bacterium]